MFCTEQFLRAINRQLLHRIHVFTTTVPTLLGITLCVFIREHRTLRFHHSRAGEVFTRDEFDVLLLAQAFVFNGAGNLAVHAFQFQFR